MVLPPLERAKGPAGGRYARSLNMMDYRHSALQIRAAYSGSGGEEGEGGDQKKSGLSSIATLGGLGVALPGSRPFSTMLEGTVQKGAWVLRQPNPDL
ncbi:hypothetical protein KM043_012670 [Ampulex compressa]|nr:hypothetical protein KM043_012670 [Ampulex compressa]